MHNKFGLPERTINELIQYFSNKPEIEKVLIFGSRAKGNYKNGSDIDFAIWTNAHDKITSILGELEDLPTPYRFDIVDFKTLKHQGMIDSITKDGILFYEKSENNKEM